MTILLLAVLARPDMLVDTDWLSAHLNDRGIRIVDMRSQATMYAEGHIPGAVRLENAAIRDLQNPPEFVPKPEAFEKLMASLGISNAMRVIAYDERGGIYAARLWWILNYYGHSNVALLDGGWVKWTKENRKTDRDVPKLGLVNFSAKRDARWIATARDVTEAIGKPGRKIVDARTPAEIEGKDLRGIKNGGHIPSAIPVYWEDALDPNTKAFKPISELKKLWDSKGIRPTDEVIAYCQVGMRASHDLFVLHLLGYSKLRNYFGAWEEWGNRDDLPIVRPK